MLLSRTTCSWPAGRHTASHAQRHPQGTGGTPACLRPALGCGYHVLPEVPFQPRTHLGSGHFCPRALSQQDRAAPRHQASCRWKDTWCILPTSPRDSAHLPIAGHPVLPVTGARPLLCLPCLPRQPPEWRLHIYSHCRGLCQHPKAFMKKPLSASLPPPPTPPPPLHLDHLPVLPSPPHPPFINPTSPPFPPSLLPSTPYLPPTSLGHFSATCFPSHLAPKPLLLFPPGHSFPGAATWPHFSPAVHHQCRNSSAG